VCDSFHVKCSFCLTRELESSLKTNFCRLCFLPLIWSPIEDALGFFHFGGSPCSNASLIGFDRAGDVQTPGITFVEECDNLLRHTEQTTMYMQDGFLLLLGLTDGLLRRSNGLGGLGKDDGRIGVSDIGLDGFENVFRGTRLELVLRVGGFRESRRAPTAAWEIVFYSPIEHGALNSCLSAGNDNKFEGHGRREKSAGHRLRQAGSAGFSIVSTSMSWHH